MVPALTCALRLKRNRGICFDFFNFFLGQKANWANAKWIEEPRKRAHYKGGICLEIHTVEHRNWGNLGPSALHSYLWGPTTSLWLCVYGLLYSHGLFSLYTVPSTWGLIPCSGHISTSGVPLCCVGSTRSIHFPIASWINDPCHITHRVKIRV